MLQDTVVTGRRSEEQDAGALPGLLGVAAALVFGFAALIALGTALLFGAFLAFLFAIAAVLSVGGLIVLQPNEASVVVVFGSYRGTVRRSGFWWVNPLSFGQRQTISLRTRNFISNTSKVNDANGNPIHIAAVVVWQVVDTAPAVFDVEDYERFVFLQAETAVRHVARSYPYDAYGDDAGAVTLTGNADAVADTLTSELQDRLLLAGVHVVEARLTDLAYAPEIAEVMLRRQQASAVVAARQRIVEGAVGMVRLAVEQIDAEDIAHLDAGQKAMLVSNLLTVLVSEAPTTPTVNVGPASTRSG